MARKRNPIRGIESKAWLDEEGRLMFENPIRGIESSLHLLSPSGPYLLNPIRGIERALARKLEHAGIDVESHQGN